MQNLIEKIAIAAVVVFIAVACIGMYYTWKNCDDAGGTTVRGLFQLECIKK